MIPIPVFMELTQGGYTGVYIIQNTIVVGGGKNEKVTKKTLLYSKVN